MVKAHRKQGQRDEVSGQIDEFESNLLRLGVNSSSAGAAVADGTQQPLTKVCHEYRASCFVLRRVDTHLLLQQTSSLGSTATRGLPALLAATRGVAPVTSPTATLGATAGATGALGTTGQLDAKGDLDAETHMQLIKDRAVSGCPCRQRWFKRV